MSNYTKSFFIYPAVVSSIANGATAKEQINIEADSDFVIQKITCFADIAGAVQTDSSRVLPLVTMQVTDTGSSERMFNEPVSIPSICGKADSPFILTVPYLVRANANMTIDFANYSAGTTYANLYVNFIGYKVRKYSR